MYFKTEQAFKYAVEQAYDESLWCVSATDRAVTFAQGDSIIQLMHFDFFQDAAAIFDAFDYTVCMAAYDLDTSEFCFHDDFFKHASQRFLKFHSGTRYPFGSLLRVLKYQSRGYTLGKGDLIRIALCCHRVPINSWDELASAIGGQYGEKVLLDSSKPFSIDAAIDVIPTLNFTVPEPQGDMPAYAEELLIKIGLLKVQKAAA
jgi:hypothetical protein